MSEIKLQKSNSLMLLLRGAVIVLVSALIIPPLNPARMSELIDKNSAFFTMATSYGSLSEAFTRAINRGWVDSSTLITIYISSLLGLLCILTIVAGCCMTLGKKRLQKLGTLIISIGSSVGILDLMLLIPAYLALSGSSRPGSIKPMFAFGFWVFTALFIACGVLALINMKSIPKLTEEDKYEMEAKYRLFLMILPFVILCFAFCYLPLWGWRYSFFDYKPGIDLSSDNFVGFKWFTFLFKNAASRADIIRVMTNTLAMSGLGIITSFVPMAFAIFLTEIKSNKFRKLVQVVTTIPNFISWVLVFSFAFALFSTEGFVNSMLIDLGLIKTGTNFLMSGSHIWLKMWAWGTWKGLGWSAIIYIAAISSIDQQLYEAATVDGAGRFKRIWHITVPGLIPTFCVLLLLGIAGILSNGMDQYYVFRNSANQNPIEVLDLYVYLLGLGNGGTGNIPLATVVGMMKSIISVVLLLGANWVSKLIRGDSII
ncbi:sugar ABC transporter permease [Clostridium sp. 19966]|uniref:ABC transporter permease subunit n=1 Tax=Clostridium sp. 19966 TaxID=2768166 RepID=UPI0028DE208C|nr:ABC transporter permease subunit [Clostridium sp. 19966]MDT8717370.1 sugar ABC transporter permease [Clostridium sp. 19966]